MSERHFQFESGPIIKTLAGLFIAAVIALGIFALVSGNGLAIMLLVILAITTGIGIVLERVDSSRKGSQGARAPRTSTGVITVAPEPDDTLLDVSSGPPDEKLTRDTHPRQPTDSVLGPHPPMVEPRDHRA